jgi:DNA-binding GntR family transcriptional regulator
LPCRFRCFEVTSETKSTVPAIIAEALRERIATGVLHPNEHLVESAIAIEFETSRAPVREALLMLETDGLVTRSPHRGFVVKKFSREEIHELYDATFRLEEVAFVKAITNATDVDFARLELNLRNQKRAIEAHDVRAYYFLNEEFHTILMEAAGNSFIARMHRSLRRASRPLSMLNMGQGLNMSHSHAEHCDQLEALRRRNAEAGLAAIRKQEQRSLRTLDIFYT